MSEGPIDEAARLFAEVERLEKELALVTAGGYQLGWDRATAKMEGEVDSLKAAFATQMEMLDLAEARLANRGEEIASGWVVQRKDGHWWSSFGEHYEVFKYQLEAESQAKKLGDCFLVIPVTIYKKGA